MANDVRIGVGATDNASSTLDKIRDKFDQLGASKGAQSILMGVGMKVGEMAFDALGKAAQAAGNLITGSVDAAKAQEVASAKLDQALRNNGTSLAAQSGAIEEVIKKGVDLGFNDDLITDGMARLVTATGSVSEAAYAMGVAQDLARFKGVSLEQATDALTKIEGGRFRGLADLGIVLEKGMTIQDALTAVEAKAAGQKEAFAKTEVGAWDRVGAKWDQVKEQIGNKLIGPLTDLANGLADIIPAVSGVIDSFGKLGPVFVGVGTAAAVALAPGLFAAAAGAAALTIAALPVILPLAALAAAVALVTSQLGKAHSGYGDMGNGLNVFGERVDGADQKVDSFGHTVEATTPIVGAFADASLAAAAQVALATQEASDRAAESYVSVGGAAEAAGYKVGTAAFDSGTAATKAAGVIYTAMTDIGSSFKSAASAAIAAVNAEITGAYDPQITAAELVQARLALADDKKKLSAKGVTAEEKAQLDLQILNDRMHIAELEAEQLTYGTAAQQTAKITGFLTGAAHAAALKSTNPQEKEAADTLDTTLRAVLLKLQQDAPGYGTKTGAAYAGSLASAVVNGKRVLVAAVNQLRGVVYATSPPGPESPLHEIGTWGFNTGQHYIDKMADALGNTSGVKSALAGLTPAFAGGGGGGGGGGSGGGSGGGLTVNGPLVSYSPMLSTASPGELERASRILGPGIVRELRGRGLIPQGSY